MIGRQKQPLLVHLKATEKLEFEKGELKIHLPPGEDFLPKALERSSNREILEMALKKVWGDQAAWRCLASERETPPPSQEPKPDAGSKETARGRKPIREFRRYWISLVERWTTSRNIEEPCMNIRQLMKQAQQMQEKMQRELAELVVEAGVGGGMVTVQMSGKKQLVSVKLDPEVVDPEDPSMLEDLILAAVNEASRQVDEALQGKMGSLASGLPGMM